MENESLYPSMIRTGIVVNSTFNMENNNDETTIDLKEKKATFPCTIR
jgi:hypothetical protein